MKKQLLFLFMFSMTLGLVAQSDNCLKFDGVASRVKYSTDTTLDNLNGATDYTIEAWFYPTDADIHNRVILKRWYQFAITLYKNDLRRIYFTHYTNNGQDRVYVNSLYNVVNLNQWNHVAVINNSTDNTLKIYMNGVDVTADSSGTATTQTALTLEANPGSNANLYVAYGGSDTVFNGFVDKVRIKKTAEDIANLNTNDPLAMPYTTDADTVLLMNFNEGSGTTTVNEATGTDADLQCSGGCSEIPTWYPVQTTMVGINNLNQIDFSVYPNPVRAQGFMIKASDNQNIIKVQILDITGKVVRNFVNKARLSQLKMATDNLMPGAYLVKVKTNEGTGVQKLLVK